MNRIVEILIIVVVLFIVATIFGCKKKGGIEIINCTFKGEIDPNQTIKFDNTNCFIIENCSFEFDPELNESSMIKW